MQALVDCQLLFDCIDHLNTAVKCGYFFSFVKAIAGFVGS